MLRSLRAALMNLLNNAADSSPQGIDIHTHWDQARFTLEIRDHGPGLSVLFDLGEQLVLDVQILDDRLDDEIACSEFCDVVGEVAGRYQPGIVAVHERCGL